MFTRFLDLDFYVFWTFWTVLLFFFNFLQLFKLTVQIPQEGNSRFQHSWLIHLPTAICNHRAQFINQHIELIPSFLLAQIPRLPATTKKLSQGHRRLYKTRADFPTLITNLPTSWYHLYHHHHHPWSYPWVIVPRREWS